MRPQPIELIQANCSGGRITVTQDPAGTKKVTIRLPGVGERTIMASAITEIRIGLGLWYFVGFMRNLTLNIMGAAPLKLNNMSKSKALRVKALLGF